MYKVKVTFRVKKELRLISLQHQKAILEVFEDLQSDPFLGKPLTRGLTGKFSYRIGMYRIIYKVVKKDRLVLIITAGHRSVVFNN